MPSPTIKTPPQSPAPKTSPSSSQLGNNLTRTFNRQEGTSVPLTLQGSAHRGLLQISPSELHSDPNSYDTTVQIREGDVLLNKDPTRQNLVVIKGFEMEVQEGSEPQSNIRTSCIDRSKKSPGQGHMDVTYNLKDWDLKEAKLLSRLLEYCGANRRSLQYAIWNITGNESVSVNAKELLEKAGIDPQEETTLPHLSNPNNSSQATAMVVPPELQGRIA